jgi:RNA polymerase sigma-70 factor (ECF subfamily)
MTPQPHAAFVSTLFRQYYGELLAFLTGKLGCRRRAEDVAQDTYERLLQVADPRQIEQPRAFLYKIAVNLTIDTFRRRGVREDRAVAIAELDTMPSAAPAPDRALDAKQRLDILQRAIAELPPKCRQVFVLHKFLEVPHAEIAARLGISKNMVEKHVIKAMAHCRRRLTEEEP